ncbi:DNA mismatch repair protein MLH1 [Chlorella vulgaris]
MGDAAAPQPRIHRLDEAVVNRIAAGEIIQAGRMQSDRPASALKEMSENSLGVGVGRAKCCDDLQRLQVMAGCLLLCRQGAAAADLTFGPPELAAAKRRLAALMADPAMRLSDLAAEVACLAGGQGGAAREAAVQDSISRMLGRGGAAMKALTAGFSTALLAHLLLGSASPEAQQQASLAIRRCGGGDLEAEVDALEAQLAGLAAVGQGCVQAVAPQAGLRLVLGAALCI